MATIERAETIAVLLEEFESFGSLLRELDSEDWSKQTCLPGWDVQATVAHIVGTEQMMAGDETPALPDDADLSHVRNDIGTFNEAYVHFYASATPAEMIVAYDRIVARRRETLNAVTDEEFNAEAWTPAGKSTFGRFLCIRNFDTWMHDQDIRRVVGRPGNDDTAPANAAIDEIGRGLPFVVGKRAGAPAGSSVTINVTGPVERTFHILVGDRAAAVDSLDGEPTVSLTTDTETFIQLAGGRADPGTLQGQVTLTGDAELGDRLVNNMAFVI